MADTSPAPVDPPTDDADPVLSQDASAPTAALPTAEVPPAWLVAKDEGNKLFKEGDVAGAVDKWRLAVDAAIADAGRTGNRAAAICASNIAAARLSEKDGAAALEAASESLSYDATYVECACTSA